MAGCQKIYVITARRTLALALCAVLWSGVAAVDFGQTQSGAQGQNARPVSSELAKQNFSQVAASAGSIKVVLLKDVGLMVELKRWVAKDATDHGQIVSDQDLTDDAIFDRLENDIEFR